MDPSGPQAKMVGNDFFVTAQRLQPATPVASPAPIIAAPIISTPAFTESLTLDYEFENVNIQRARRFGAFGKALDFAHNYSVGTFALMFLVVGASATQVVGTYYANKIADATPVSHITRSGQPLAGLNTSVPTPQLSARVKAITTQPLTINMGGHVETIPAKTVQNWLQIVSDKATNTSYIHVKDKTIYASLKSIASANSRAAKDQVYVKHGGIKTMISGGSNGIKVGDPAAAAKDISKHLLAGSGLSEQISTHQVAFKNVGPSAFAKMIEVNVNTKQMYLYENGKMIKQYPISAGKPSTPTPIGQFKTFTKLADQNMEGYNADGSKYFQPHVKWISYFAPGGVGIHGVYWHGPSWFGNINSSHGCVGLPDWQAKEVYDWAPVGTTVITHT